MRSNWCERKRAGCLSTCVPPPMTCDQCGQSEYSTRKVCHIVFFPIITNIIAPHCRWQIRRCSVLFRLTLNSPFSSLMTRSLLRIGCMSDLLSDCQMMCVVAIASLMFRITLSWSFWPSGFLEAQPRWFVVARRSRIAGECYSFTYNMHADDSLRSQAVRRFNENLFLGWNPKPLEIDSEIVIKAWYKNIVKIYHADSSDQRNSLSGSCVESRTESVCSM